MRLGSLLNGREDEFAQDLYMLSQRPIFDVVAFEDFVDKIRSCVAEVTAFSCIINFAKCLFISFIPHVIECCKNMHTEFISGLFRRALVEVKTPSMT